MRHTNRRILLALLCTVLTITQALPAAAASTDFSTAASDAAATSTAAAATSTKTNPTKSVALAKQVLVAQGVLRQKQTTRAGLKKKVTRQQFAKMLVKLSAYKDKVASSTRTSMYSDVKSTSSYAPYIRIAVENGWMKGNLRGKFRPRKAVTLQEAISAVVAVLGYEDSDFQGNLSSAKYSFYKSEKLNTNISKKRSQALTYQDVCCLLYNMQVSATKSGTIYAGTLGYALDTNGDIDYLELAFDQLDGPVIAQSNWQEQIPFKLTNATIYIDGSKSSADQVKPYDVLYYSKKLKSVYVYQERVTGRLNSVSPDRYTPQSVTVGGTTYSLAAQTAAYAVSAMGDYAVGDYVTLLLGKDDTVVGIGSPAELNSFTGGIVLSKTEKVGSDKADTTVKKYITVLNTLGETQEYVVSDLTGYSEKTPVEISYDNGTATVNKVTIGKLNGTVSSDAGSFAGYTLSKNIRILEYNSNGTYSTLSRSRLAGLTINSSSILYYHVNAGKEITDLIVTGVTGDSYKYGILKSATEITDEETMTFSGSYSYQIGDESGYASSSGQIFGVDGYVGPAQFAFASDGSLTGIKTLGSLSVTSISQTEASNGTSTYELADNVGVYLKKGSSYYSIALSKVMSLSNYQLAAYYDGTTGGRIRVIIATAK